MSRRSPLPTDSVCVVSFPVVASLVILIVTSVDASPFLKVKSQEFPSPGATDNLI